MNYKQALLILSLMTACQRESPTKKHENASIKEATKTYVDAINNQDLSIIDNSWTEDGIYYDLSKHEIIQGKENIVKYFEDQFKASKDFHIDYKVESINYTDSGVVEVGTFKIIRDSNEEENAFKAQFKLVNGNWLIQKIDQADFKPPLSNYEHLKDLEWLIGRWVDKDEFADLTYDYKWDENRNFILLDFNMKVLGRDQLKGHQVIGWDPVKEKIHSWIFDSDGGFGQGIWSKDGNNWVAKILYTLPDGRIGSSIQIYTKVNEDSFTYSSENREVGGNLLPNIGPYKAVRK